MSSAAHAAMLRSLPRASTSSALVARASGRWSAFAIQQRRADSSHAISNPTLAGIEKRWETMAPQEQANLWMQLRDRMKNDWNGLTLQERKAAYWIAFGPHGPRALPPPGEGLRVFWYTLAGVGVSLGLFMFIHSLANPAPESMTREWQEASNEYLKSQNSEPITGISSENYKGPGMIQSKPKSSK